MTDVVRLDGGLAGWQRRHVVPDLLRAQDVAIRNATLITITPCTSSAAKYDASIPTALKAIQNASAFTIQCATVHRNTAANRDGLRSTLRPDANATSRSRPRASNRGATRRESSSYHEITTCGRKTSR